MGEKDDYVVAASVEAEARVNQADLPIRALSPGEFIKSVIPSHVDYPEVR